MTDAELNKIEEELGISLPEFYRSTTINYPFPHDSYVAEFLLVNDPSIILRPWLPDDTFPGIGKPYRIGSDGGEEDYFIDVLADEYINDAPKWHLSPHFSSPFSSPPFSQPKAAKPPLDTQQP
jgi:hypothetical protein